MQNDEIKTKHKAVDEAVSTQFLLQGVNQYLAQTLTKTLAEIIFFCKFWVVMQV